MNKFPIFVLVAAAAWAQTVINETATREFGQLRLQALNATSGGPNLVEGRELNGPQAIAFDTSASPPILYVADFGNNRVLAWKNPAGLSNGAPADLVVGQRDLFSTNIGGPGSGGLSTGLRGPTAVAVDPSGNLFVLDSGNARILRYPSPFRQTGDLLNVDLVIGQRTTSSGGFINEGEGAPSAKSLSFRPYDNGPLLASGMALDGKGNLWVADAGNNRVLRFPGVVNLTPNTLEPAADIVLGQTTFTSGTLPPTDPQTYPGGARTNPGILSQPSGVAVDAAGRVYVTDNYARVLYFNQQLVTSVPAARILGIPHTPPQGTQLSPYPNSESVGVVDLRTFQISPAQGIFTDGTYLYVCDTPAHRITRYDAPERWLQATDKVPSPPIADWFGQPDQTSGKKNRGQVEASSTGLNGPVAGAFLGTDLWVVDTGNNRVLDFPAASPLHYNAAVRVIAQIDFAYSSPNLVEGRELWISSSTPGGAVVVDKSSNPPHLFIADTFNNRILGFFDARKVGTDSRSILTQTADLVIGQIDKFRTTINSPSGLPEVRSDTGLYQPVGLAMDASGNLWVADSGNGRVLRYPAPFNQTPGSIRASLVLGKGTFNEFGTTDAGVRNLAGPYGLALLSDGSLAVSDVVHNRVVVFRRPRGGDFANGQQGDIVLGQRDFSQSGSGTSLGNLKGPAHIAADSSDRLYVCDSGNNRLLIFTNTLQSANGATAAFQLGGPNTTVNSPFGVAVSPVTGEIWLANSLNNVVYRLPEFTFLLLNPNTQPTQIPAFQPLAVALDPFDNLIIAEGLTNRVTFYYAKLTFQHAATYNQRPLAPGQLAYLYRLGKDFDLPTADGTGSNPWPAVLSDYRITVNGISAPIFRISKTRIDFQVPITSPSSGTAEFLVQRDSTGEIVATANLNMAGSNPGFFTSNAIGTGQAAAINDDGTINGPANPVGRGKVISFYLTGQGFVDNAPRDGAVPASALPTRVKPTVLSPSIGIVDPKYVLYSGLGAFAGGWQINYQVPEAVPPGNNNVIVITMNDVPSNVGATGGIVVTYAVK